MDDRPAAVPAIVLWFTRPRAARVEDGDGRRRGSVDLFTADTIGGEDASACHPKQRLADGVGFDPDLVERGDEPPPGNCVAKSAAEEREARVDEVGRRRVAEGGRDRRR